MIVGAGAAYPSGGDFGAWEIALTAELGYVAFRGLDSWTFIGIGWLLHTACTLGKARRSCRSRRTRRLAGPFAIP
ncbi:DUF6010 family protein [Amycolatopsis sp. 195334CR]|uniref:DUF6010 family protein n=1 Tax=Amycolatopsis sp. 195334CR TaxID=2814588 RepID=UPI0027DAF332|nr:DUF6010 family protein [Amycolatopsis sp. 195334CR]